MIMRSKLLWVFLLVLSALPLSGETWYIRHDGGSRYSAKVRTGQCDGKADVAYRGKGTNQHCAFNDFRYLYDDRSYGNTGWVIAGGDTVIVRNGPWRIGFSAPDNTDAWCVGLNGAAACSAPSLPAGTPTQHTRILGENYANCGTSTTTDRSKLTQLYGGFGLGTVINMQGAQYVDMECIEITRHSQCISHGLPAYPKTCDNRFPGTDDFDSDGMATDINTHDLLLQDVWIHGHTDRGIVGPIGGTVTCLRCNISYNGMAGWDFDNGHQTPSVNAVWNFSYSTIEWNGCNQEYPLTHPNPAISCYGQSNAGYGDGVGTPPNMCLTSNIDHSVFRYNTQDGIDLGHIDKGACALTITNSMAYGNNGGQFKWGPNENPAIFVNNLIMGNCMRMSEPIAGTPATYNKNLGDFCRANDNIAFNFRQGGTLLMANNTIVGYAPTTFDINCWDPSCSNSTFTFKNNLILGYDNPHTYNLGGKNGGPGSFFFQNPIGHVVRSNNMYYGIRNVGIKGNERVEDPKFVSQPRFTKEQDLDNFNFHLSAASPARGAGVHIPEIKNDYDGKPRPAGNYDLGALQF
jgi:hypothetical protein